MEQINKKKRQRLVFQERTEEASQQTKDIRERIIFFFKQHIGLENAVYPTQIFEYIYGVHPKTVPEFKRIFFWNLIKKMLRVLKHEGIIFVTNRGPKWFVLQSIEELGYYKKRSQRHRDNLANLEAMAEQWVLKQKWKNL